MIRETEDVSRLNSDLAPSIPISDCPACKTGHIYKSPADAITHLRTTHFRSVNRPDDSLGTGWTQSADSIRRRLLNRHHLRLVDLYKDYLKDLYKRAKAIHDRTSSRDDGDAGCTLPRGLVECFETIILFTVQIRTIAYGMQEEVECKDVLPANDFNLRMYDYAFLRLGHLGEAAKLAMSRAETALIRSDPTAVVELGPAGPDLLIAVMLQNVRARSLLPDEERNYDMYHKYASKLVRNDLYTWGGNALIRNSQDYQINQFPRRRLLHDIQVLHEELDVVRRVNHWQHECIANFMILLNPNYFPRPTKERKSMFPAEQAALQRTLESLAIEDGELEALNHRVLDLRNKLRQSVEILEEDHGKAIFVFTMVTTIFLPL